MWLPSSCTRFSQRRAGKGAVLARTAQREIERGAAIHFAVGPDAAAMTVQDYMGGDPATVIAAYEAELQAEASFMTASVSYSGPYNPATMGPVREQVDAIVAAKFGDAAALCVAE